MPFQSGDDWAASGGNPHGRGRSLSRELRRAEQAAEHVARLTARPGSITRTARGLAERYKAGERDLPFIDARSLAGLHGDRIEIELREQLAAKSRAILLSFVPRMAGLLDDIAESALLAATDARPKGRRRKRRKDDGDVAWRQHWMTAGAALDRLVPDDPEMPQ